MTKRKFADRPGVVSRWRIELGSNLAGILFNGFELRVFASGEFTPQLKCLLTSHAAVRSVFTDIKMKPVIPAIPGVLSDTEVEAKALLIPEDRRIYVSSARDLKQSQ